MKTPTSTKALFAKLSRREMETYALVAQGMSDKEIAEELKISRSGVRRHMERLFFKLGSIRSRGKLTQIFFQNRRAIKSVMVAKMPVVKVTSGAKPPAGGPSKP
jgi:DNA-binding NarL/FixJ family response regulator